MFSLNREEEKPRFTSFKIIDRREVSPGEPPIGPGPVCVRQILNQAA